MSLGSRRDTGKRFRGGRPAARTTRPFRVRQPREPGESFGLYTLREVIGEGSTCVVFAAEHPVWRGPLAIKVLHHRLLGDPTVAQRMVEEASMISRLDHPGIVEVFDIGCSTAGRPFVVLERLVGEPLSKRLQRGRLPEAHIVTFIRQLAAALDVAHRDGIVHRDLKPENIYIVAEPASSCGERIKVLDFGIAKSRVSTFHTGTGIVLGTPAYMAPEQARGMRHLDGRADIYALGVVMYVMATGSLPFIGTNTDEVLAEHAYCEPVPVTELADVTPELSAIIERCLAKRPEERYPGMCELATALADIEVSRRGAPAVPQTASPGAPVPDLPAPAAPAAPAASAALAARWPWRRVLALAAPTAITIVIAMAIGMAPMAASTAPAQLAPTGFPLEPAGQPEPPARTPHPLREPLLPVASDRARLPPRRPAPPFSAKRVAPAKPAASTKPIRPARMQVHWDPDALWFPQHEPPFLR